MPTRSLFERIIDGCSPEPMSGCWLWKLCTAGHGYALLTIGRRSDGTRKRVAGHVLSYVHFKGPIPEGLELDHKCRTPSCVNPDHLEPVTHQENMRRGFGASGLNYRKTSCKWGHLFDENNTFIYRHPSGRVSRRCKECNNERQRKKRGYQKRIHKTHCPHGHEYTQDNSSYSGGRRHCKKCHRDHAALVRQLRRDSK